MLVFCSNGQNRSLCVVVAILMKRFRWSFYKTLEYLDYKRANLEIHKVYFSNLKAACERFEKQVRVSTTWDVLGLCEARFRDEEVIVVNTYLNAQAPPKSTKLNSNRDASLSRKFVAGISTESDLGRRVVWADQLVVKPRRVIKSVGKTTTKKSNQSETSSVAPKKAREKGNIKTEVEESFVTENGVSSEVLRILELGKVKRLTDKPKVKKTAVNELSKLKEEKIGKFLATAAGTRLKISSENDLGQCIDNLAVQKLANSSNEFYKKNLKTLNHKIFNKPAESNGNDKEKSSVSKTSTNVQEDSKQTPNDSDVTMLQTNSFTVTQTRQGRQTQTHLNSFKERNNKDIFVEMQRNARTVYNKDEFYKSGEGGKGVHLPELNPELRTVGEGHPVDKITSWMTTKNAEDMTRLEEKKLELQSKLRNLGSDRFMKLPEETLPAPPFKSTETNENFTGVIQTNTVSSQQKAKLVPNSSANRPNSAPPKEDQTQVPLQKHLLFDAKSRQLLVNKLSSLTSGQLFAAKLPTGLQIKDKQAMKDRLFKQG